MNVIGDLNLYKTITARNLTKSCHVSRKFEYKITEPESLALSNGSAHAAALRPELT